MKTLSRLEQRVWDLERAIAVAKVDGLITRVRSGYPVEKPTVAHTPAYFVRPEGYRVPTLRQWKRYVEARQGVFTLDKRVSVLCIACGMPIDASSGDKTVIGVRGNKTVNGNSLARVTIGAVVKWTEEAVTVENAYSDTLPTEVNIEQRKVYRVVTHKALGCMACQQHMLTVSAESKRRYERQYTAYITKLAELNSAIEQYRKSITRYKARSFVVYHTLPNTALLTPNASESPKQSTAYILVDVHSIAKEQTVAYWREQHA